MCSFTHFQHLLLLSSRGSWIFSNDACDLFADLNGCGMEGELDAEKLRDKAKAQDHTTLKLYGFAVSKQAAELDSRISQTTGLGTMRTLSGGENAGLEECQPALSSPEGKCKNSCYFHASQPRLLCPFSPIRARQPAGGSTEIDEGECRLGSRALQTKGHQFLQQ